MESNTAEGSAAPASLKEVNQRLMALAHFLMRGELSHETFDFSVFNQGGDVDQPCGHTGCAIGELPACFPLHWEFAAVLGFQNRFLPILVSTAGMASVDSLGDAATFFGLSRRAAVMLFSRDLDRSPDWPPFLAHVPAGVFSNADTNFSYNTTAAIDSNVERVFVAANLASFARQVRRQIGSLDELKLFLAKDVNHDEEEENAAGG